MKIDDINSRPQQDFPSKYRVHQKAEVSDIEILEDVKESEFFQRKRLERVFAVKRTFDRVSFKQAILKDCYFRGCEFIDCDFTGAQIIASNFQNAKFEGCRFEYTTFEKSEIGLDVLKHNLPAYENLKRDLARSLRTNYSEIGDYEGINFAILVELNATLDHYRKVAFSKESHYRKKYKGIERFLYAGKFFGFWALDKFWGNGERPWRLVISAFIVWVISTLYGMWAMALPFPMASFESLKIFITGNGDALGDNAFIFISLVRYLILGMFLASIVKRLARR